MFTKWIVGLIFIGILYLFNTAYSFFPENWLRRYPFLKVIAISVSVMIFGLFIKEQVDAFQRISYAKISASGNILERKNFKYIIRKTVIPEEGVLYIIENFYSESLLDVVAKKGLVVELSTRIDGAGIKFRQGKEVVESDFIIKFK